MDYLVRASAITGIRATITGLGGDADDLLARAGLLDLEKDPEAWFSYQRFLLLLEDAARATRCPHFGLELAREQGITELGPVGFVIQQAPDVRSALRELTSYFHHYNQGATVSLRTDADKAVWQFNCKLDGKLPLHQQEDLAAGIGVNLLRALYGAGWSPEAACFMHAPPEDLRPYKRMLKCPLFFNWEAPQLIFDKTILDHPLDDANPQLHKLLEDHLNALRNSYPADYCGQVRHLISHALTTGDCSIERVASHMAVGKRTLQRQLANHRVSYKDLLEDVRFDIAERYLRESSGSLTALADMLCYSDLSTFSTAFRQHHGVSPREWRKQQQARASQ